MRHTSLRCKWPLGTNVDWARWRGLNGHTEIDWRAAEALSVIEMMSEERDKLACVHVPCLTPWTSQGHFRNRWGKNNREYGLARFPELALDKIVGNLTVTCLLVQRLPLGSTSQRNVENMTLLASWTLLCGAVKDGAPKYGTKHWLK